METSLYIIVVLFALFFVPIDAVKDKDIYDTVGPFIDIYNNGTIARANVIINPIVPPPNSPQVNSKDVIILTKPNVSARIFLPTRLRPDNRRFPILIYFHGGGFCIGSAFAELDSIYLSRLAIKSKAMVVSVEYRLFPPYTLPAAYDDAWSSLQWVAAAEDQWLATHGDFSRVFIGGDSAGGNIAHHLAIRVGIESLPNGVRLEGALLATPYFLGSKHVPYEPKDMVNTANAKIWSFVCPRCLGGLDNPFINPTSPMAADLSKLGINRLVVYTAKMDELRGRGVWYYKAVKRSGWKGKARLYEAPAQRHAFNVLNYSTSSAATLIKRFAKFLNS